MFKLKIDLKLEKFNQIRVPSQRFFISKIQKPLEENMKNYKMDCDIHQNNKVICKVGGLKGFFPKFG
jgi:hypothetical protein